MGLHRKHHKQFITEISIKHQGSVFDEEGDAYWIEFPSVTDAVLAAIDMHQDLRNLQAGKGESRRLAIRAVISVGDILHQGNETIGTSMSLTARIEKITPPDEIYLSHAAWLVLNKAEVQTSFVNKFSFKGFDDPEMIYKVDQKLRTRVLTDQYIVFTDARRFTRFVKSNRVEVVEKFLIECDDLINGVCEKFGGVIRQVVGDLYFFTFADATSALNAIENLCHNWKDIIERYKVGLSVGFHKGNLNVIRSYVYGDDVHTTMYLTELDRLFTSNKIDITVITSSRIKDEFKNTIRINRFQEFDKGLLKQEVHNIVVREFGAFSYLLEDNLKL
jgi:class 3 adenylate cyclase